MMENLKKDEVPARGSLKHFSLSQVLTYLNEQKKTGILTLRNQNVIKSIYLENGNAVFASSNQEDERLGEMLLKAGKITSDQYDNSVKLLKKSSGRQGAILVELGYIAAKDLYDEVMLQVKGIILTLFVWEDGVFSFKKDYPSDEVITLDTDMESLIQEGTKNKKSKRNEEERSFIDNINELYENIDSLTYYEMFEIDIKASLSEIKKAYLKMAQNYHPDKFQNCPDSTLQDKLTSIFTLINRAYQTLSNETKRTDYDSVIFRRTAVKGVDSHQINADEQFNRGVAEYKKGNFWGAADFLRWATRTDPQNAKYWAHLSLTLCKTAKRGKEAEEAILKAIELEPHHADYYVHLGLIYLNAELKKRAVRQFETALTWDPANKKAQKELDKLKSRK